MATYNKLTCLFGHHNYSEKPAGNRHGIAVYLCKVCKRSGYGITGSDSFETWYDYDEKGNVIHEKLGRKLEFWYDYDEKGNMVYKRWRSGLEFWLGNDDRWTCKKPENWKYDTQ